MEDGYRRRAVLATIGASSAALAGCSLGNESNSDGSTPADDDDSTETPTETPRDEEEETATPNDEDHLVPPAIDYGESIAGFEDERWYGTGSTEVQLDPEEAVSGQHALRITEESTTYATAVYSFTSPLDVTGKHLSMAVKVDAPLGGRVEARFRAPNSDNRVVSTRTLPPALGEWFRVDFGISRGKGSPNLEEVQELRVQIDGSEETDIRCWIDDVRLTDGLGESHAILAFYGGRQSHYETAFPILEERGLTAAVAMPASAIGASGRMSISQLRELRDAGWDICSFPIRGNRYPEMSPEEQRTAIEEDKARLEQRGFPDGARHFFAPQHSINGDTLEILRDVHETGFLFGGNSAGMPPTAPHTIPLINGGDYDSSRAVILRADLHEQLVTLGFDEIGEGGMSVEDFEAQLDRLESNDYAGGLTVITPSELVDQHLP